MNIPYLVRHARLVLGQTQSQFAEQLGVDADTLSCWEQGKLSSYPAVISRLIEISARSGSVPGKDTIRYYPVWKFVVPMNDLRHPCAISRRVRDTLKRAGIPSHDMSSSSKDIRRGGEFSGAAALDAIQSDPVWTERRAIYAEAHCVATASRMWINLMGTPLPDVELAVIEFAPSPQGEEGGFWMRVVAFEDPPTNRNKVEALVESLSGRIAG